MPSWTEIKLAVSAGRKLITFCLVLAVAAAFYVWLQAAKADRAQLLAQANGICTAAGVPFQPEGSKQAVWGKACQARVAYLVAFQSQTVTGGLADAVAAMEAREGKQAADGALAALYANRTLQSQQRMEAADAAVQNDRVGPGWAAAVNDLGQLR